MRATGLSLPAHPAYLPELPPVSLISNSFGQSFPVTKRRSRDAGEPSHFLERIAASRLKGPAPRAAT